ncbi:MAG: cellulase family glycosylhydrolase [Actinobacteria bacterium]|nr:cellulase family glycosylhydrolase [Actinomycetota bacterium]
MRIRAFFRSSLLVSFSCALLVAVAFVAPAAAAPHTLDFDNDPAAATITPGFKSYSSGSTTVTDRIFRDGLGREVAFSGWNVSGEVKHVESGFKPFHSLAHADEAFDTMGEQAGSNIVRFTLAWEGVNPSPGVIDYAYLDAISAQIKSAIRNRMYVLVDYHQDNYSRYMFRPDSWYTGAANDFWHNRKINGKYVQTEFLWQLEVALKHIKSKLSAAEWSYVVGVDPWNEPFDGGFDLFQSAAQWERTYLWPFHKRVRARADAAGWNTKPVFAELLVFWNSLLGTIAPATGGFNINETPGQRYVFNSHLYDQARMGISSTPINNGTYFGNVDQVRDVSRRWQSPPFISEFGAPLGGSGAKDEERSRNAVHQAMEIGDRMHAKDRYADAYTPLVSGTEWHWDYYWNRHHEYFNFGTNLLSAGDAWNGENFSAIGYEPAFKFNLDSRNVQRIYPRRTQGDVMSFHYANRATDNAGQAMNWSVLRPRGAGTEYMRGNEFALHVWRGRAGDAPTELFVPNAYVPGDLAVITEKQTLGATAITASPSGAANEVMLTRDLGRRSPAAAGNRLLVWDDADAGESATTWHYALVFKKNGSTWTPAQLATLQSQLNDTIQTRMQSPIYLTGAMTASGYPGESAP